MHAPAPMLDRDSPEALALEVERFKKFCARIQAMPLSEVLALGGDPVRGKSDIQFDYETEADMQGVSVSELLNPRGAR